MFQFMMCMATSGKEQEDVEDVGVVYGFIVAPCAKRPDDWASEPFYTIGHRHIRRPVMLCTLIVGQ
jgi:hypothetical protein